MSERWRMIEEIYEAAVARPARLRAAFLDASCAGDADLRRQVEELLDQDASAVMTSPGRPLGQAGEPQEDPALTVIGAGSRLGPYELLSAIGAGGMGQVFRGRDTRLGRMVAIKISQAGFSDRFAREARVIASLNHPNICTLYDVGPNYLVMELVEGQNLKGPLPAEQALRYGSQLAIVNSKPSRVGVCTYTLPIGRALRIRRCEAAHTVFSGLPGHVDPRRMLGPIALQLHAAFVSQRSFGYAQGQS